MVLLELNLNIHKCKYNGRSCRLIPLRRSPVVQVDWAGGAVVVCRWQRNYIALHAAKDSSVECELYCRQRPMRLV